MKKILLGLTLLLTSTMGMASDEKRAQDAIMKVFTMKVKQKLNPYVKPAIKKIGNRLNNRYGNDGKPSATVKSLGATVKALSELAQPDVTVETENTKTRVRVLEFKTLKIDFNSKNSDLKFNFETNGKDAKFGLGMSF